MSSVPVKLRPGGEFAARPLHFIWLADCSGSMTQDGKIQALNHAIREVVPHMRRAADDNPGARVLVRAVCFADDARWHIKQPTPIGQFTWSDMTAGGRTSMGKALRLVIDELRVLEHTERLLPPVLVLISDGEPTDRPEFIEALRELLAIPLGQKAVRTAVAIGDDANLDVLRQFINNPGVAPVHAANPESLVSLIQWLSTQTIKASATSVPIPQFASRPMTDGQTW
jgi:uncharacterized protein YegL